MSLKNLFHIIVHELQFFHELEHKSLNVSLIIIHIIYITKFYMQNSFYLLLVKFNIFYQK